MTVAQVTHESERSPHRTSSGATFATLIDRSAGTDRIEQRVVRADEGDEGRIPTSASSDTVLYVFAGLGSLFRVNGQAYPIRPGVAVLLKETAWWRLVATEGQLGVAVVVAPPWRFRYGPAGLARRFRARDPDRPIAVVLEENQEKIPAGDDRYFRLLIDPRHGAKHVTQFVGFIDRSRAPFHTHTYEEAIYILEGEGIVHIEGHADHPIMPGTSIFLPPGTPHCLENASDGVLKLLGVFSPPGSPASKMED